ncbi:MAG: hypothetical protein HYT72_02100 [Candidatus Aenigmarchaeota archaeon]|nr:hypothetical protein [Candidatus Aenigmarchaeota archaeon]
MRMEYILVGLIIALVVLLALLVLSGGIVPGFKEGLKSLANFVGIKV